MLFCFDFLWKLYALSKQNICPYFLCRTIFAAQAIILVVSANGEIAGFSSLQYRNTFTIYIDLLISIPRYGANMMGLLHYLYPHSAFSLSAIPFAALFWIRVGFSFVCTEKRIHQPSIHKECFKMEKSAANSHASHQTAIFFMTVQFLKTGTLSNWNDTKEAIKIRMANMQLNTDDEIKKFIRPALVFFFKNEFWSESVSFCQMDEERILALLFPRERQNKRKLGFL